MLSQQLLASFINCSCLNDADNGLRAHERAHELARHLRRNRVHIYPVPGQKLAGILQIVNPFAQQLERLEPAELLQVLIREEDLEAARKWRQRSCVYSRGLIEAT